MMYFNFRLAQVVKVGLALAIFVTYGLQCYVAVDIAWNEYLGVKFEQNKRQLFWEYFTRTCLVLVTCKYISTLILYFLVLLKTVHQPLLLSFFSSTGGSSSKTGPIHLTFRCSLPRSPRNGVTSFHRHPHLLALLHRFQIHLHDLQKLRSNTVWCLRLNCWHLH